MAFLTPFNPHNQEEEKKVQRVIDEWALVNYPLLSTDLNPGGNRALKNLMEKADDLLKEGQNPIEMIKTIFEYQNKCLSGYLWWYYAAPDARYDKPITYWDYPYLDAYIDKVYRGITKGAGSLFLIDDYKGNQDLLDFALRVYGYPLSYGLDLHSVDNRVPGRLLHIVNSNHDLDFTKYVLYYQKIWDLYDQMKDEVPECYMRGLADSNIYHNCCQLMKIMGQAKLNDEVERRLIAKMFEFRDFYKDRCFYDDCMNILVDFVATAIRSKKYPDLYKQIADYVYENQLINGDFSLVNILRLKFENKQEFVENVINLAKQFAMVGNLEPYNKLKSSYEVISDEDKQDLTKFVSNYSQGTNF